MSGEICPITREEIQQNDIFTFTTSNQKEIKYSAKAIQTYILTKGKLDDPLTREQLTLEDLERLEKTTGIKSKLVKKFRRAWAVISNRGLRAEFVAKFEDYANNPQDHEKMATCVTFLLVIKESIGPATYRGLVKSYMRSHPVITRPLRAFAAAVDLYLRAEVKVMESQLLVCFVERKLEGLSENVVSTVEALKSSLPLFEIRTLSSVSQTILDLI